MATTYLTLVNRTLRELNETELTSATFSSSRGVQTAVKDFVNKSIHDIYNEAGELPILYSETTNKLMLVNRNMLYLQICVRLIGILLLLVLVNY